MELAKRGLGEVGKAPVASALWRKNVLKKCHNKHGTSKARVIPKRSQKCSLIFACV